MLRKLGKTGWGRLVGRGASNMTFTVYLDHFVWYLLDWFVKSQDLSHFCIQVMDVCVKVVFLSLSSLENFPIMFNGLLEPYRISCLPAFLELHLTWFAFKYSHSLRSISSVIFGTPPIVAFFIGKQSCFTGECIFICSLWHVWFVYQIHLGLSLILPLCTFALTSLCKGIIFVAQFALFFLLPDSSCL